MPEIDSRVFIIRSESDLNRLYDEIEKEILHQPIRVECKPHEDTRSLAQNRLLWKWNDEIGKQMIPPQNKDDTHFWLKWKILGIVPTVINGDTFNRIPESSKFGVKAMADYLTQIEALALTSGYTLTIPDDYRFAMEGR